MRERPFFITVHGIDGTGKTTTTQTLSHQLDSLGVPTINYDVFEAENVNNPFSSAKKRVLAEASPSAQLAFYLGSTMYHSDRIEELLSQGYSVVKSRYIDDVLAHHAQIGVQNGEEIASLFPIVQPDLRVILTLNEEMRRQRIVRRGVMDEKDQEIRQEGSRLDFFENYLIERTKELKKIGKSISIDTGELNPTQIAEEIINHLLMVHIIEPNQSDENPRGWI